MVHTKNMNEWTIFRLEKAGILKVRGRTESEGSPESLFAEVILTDGFVSKLAFNLTKLCTTEKSIDRYEEIVAETVKEILGPDEELSKPVELVFTVLKANRITKEKLEATLMQNGFLAAK
jgi:hypothetical protein